MSELVEKIKIAIDYSFPLRKSLPCTKTKSKWITPELKALIKKKHRLFKLYKNNLITLNSYRSYKKC